MYSDTILKGDFTLLTVKNFFNKFPLIEMFYIKHFPTILLRPEVISSPLMPH